MPYITELKSDVALRNAAPTFSKRTTANKVVLKVAPGDLTALDASIATFETSMDAVDEAKLALKSAVTSKNAAAKALRTKIGAFAKTWRADLTIPNAVLDDVNVPPHETQGSSTPATTPTELSYTLNAQNEIALKWKSNGNKSGTVYNVQTSETGSGTWTVAFTTTKKKATVTGTPGTPLYIRVVAIRGGSVSAPSTPVAVWLGSGEGFALAVAA